MRRNGERGFNPSPIEIPLEGTSGNRILRGLPMMQRMCTTRLLRISRNIGAK